MRFLAVLAFSLLVFTLPSHAAPPACNAGAEGTIVYNKDAKLVQFCNGTDWIGMVAKIGGTGDTLGDLSCSNDEVPTWDGSAWVCGAGGGGLWADSGNGYLTYTGTDVGIKIQSVTGMAAPTNTLVDLGCANDEILKWDGDSWECAADDSGSLADDSVTNAKMADDAVGLAELSATGMASATTYLRGDNTWATVPSGADNLGNHIATTVLRSDTHNTDDLGTTAIRWKDGWFAGTVTGGTFSGSGASLTSLPAANLTGTLPAISGANLTNLDAADLATGTILAARMPALTGDVTMTAGTTATTIAAGAVDLAHLSATGTKSSATFLRGDNTFSSTIVGSITATSFLYSSDARLKADIEQIVDARDKLSGIRGVTYHYKNDQKQTEHLGVLAQDVKAALPQAVATDGQGMMAVDYPALVPVLIEAVNELSVELKTLKAELQAERAKDQ